MIKAILIDDERSSLESLSFELEAYCPEVEVIGAFRDPAEGARKIPELKPDLVFLDIEMPGMNGFELLQSLPSISFDVIFVTAYDQFAIRAFEFNALDYILKPVRKVKLVEAVNKVRGRKRHQLAPEQLAALMQNLQLQTKTGIQKIALPVGEGYSMVNVSEISYLHAESNYTWVHLINQEKHLITKTLKEIESLLDVPFFFRPHKSYLVNLNHIEKYIRGQGGILVTSNNDQIPVARSQKNELIEILKRGI